MSGVLRELLGTYFYGEMCGKNVRHGIVLPGSLCKIGSLYDLCHPTHTDRRADVFRPVVYDMSSAN